MFCSSVAINEITSSRTPTFIKIRYYDVINLLSNYLQNNGDIPVSEFKNKKSDPIIIQHLKELANVILKNKRTQHYAWRMNSAEFFERYVQFLVKKASLSVGGSVQCNSKYNINGIKPTWCLHYLEPDIIVHLGSSTIVIDAKYKSHMLNTYETTENLKNTFRSDLHQVMAYTSLNTDNNKNAILVYPYFKKAKDKEDDNTINHTKDNHIIIPGWGTTTNIYLIGIPIKKRYQDEAIQKLIDVFKLMKSSFNLAENTWTRL